MIILSKSPRELDATALFEAVASVDFFGSDTPDQYFFDCSDELYNRSYPEQVTAVHIDYTAEQNHEFLRESAWFRAEIIKKIGMGTFQNLLKIGSSHVSGKILRNLSKIAESMNENKHLYSDQFIATYATNGYFLHDDIYTIIDSVRSISDTEKLIKQDIQAKENDFSAIEQILTDIETTEEPLPWELPLSELPADFEDLDFDWSTGETIKKQVKSPKHKTVSAKIFEPVYFLKDFIFLAILLDMVFRRDLRVSHLPRGAYMKTQLVLNDSQHTLLESMLEKAPVQFKYAARNTLNDWARDNRKNYMDQMGQMYNVRNKSLTRAAITYDKTRLKPIDSMYSLVGSHSTGKDPRFTGFGEQEGVITHKRKRRPTVLGRRSYRSKIKQRNRLDPKNDFDSIGTFLWMKGFRDKSGEQNPRRVLAFVSRVLHGGKTSARTRFTSAPRRWETVEQYSKLSKANIAKGVWTLRKGSVMTVDEKATAEKRARREADLARGISKRKAASKTAVRYKRNAIKFSAINVEKKNGSLQPKSRMPLKKSFARYFEGHQAADVLEKNMKIQMKLFAPTRR